MPTPRSVRTTLRWPAPPRPVRASANIVARVVTVFFDTVLGLSTAAIFGTCALVVLADLPIGLAITIAALSMNGMVLSLLLLGSLREGENGSGREGSAMVRPSR